MARYASNCLEKETGFTWRQETGLLRSKDASEQYRITLFQQACEVVESIAGEERDACGRLPSIHRNLSANI